MQSITYRYEDNTLEIENKRQEGNHFAKPLSTEEFNSLSSSISRELNHLPAIQLFSPKVLQFISTVVFVKQTL